MDVKDAYMRQIMSGEQQRTDAAEFVTDPVCGMKKPKNEMAVVSVFLGKNYYFCSQKDQELFDAHPDYWIPEEEREKARSNPQVL